MNTAWVIIALNTIFSSDYATENYLDTYHVSIPIPVVENDKTYVKVVFVGQSAPVHDKPTVLYEDLIITTVSYPDLKISYEKSSAKKHNIKVNENAEIGLLEEGDSPTLSIDQFLQAEEQYNTLLSELLEKDWLNKADINIEQQKQIAAELKSCWDILKVKNLNPLYESIGSNFLNWMDKHAKQQK